MKKPKIFKIISIISGIFGLIIVFSEKIIFNLIKFLMDSNVNFLYGSDSSSVGIIGGADGPTSIYLASNKFSGSKLLAVIFFLISAICAVKYQNTKDRSGGKYEE